jgi:hypothetical protein
LREARIPVGLQNPAEVGEVLLRMLVFAIGTASEPDRRRDLTGGWLLVAHVRSQPTGLGFAAPGCKHRKRRIVGVQTTGTVDFGSNTLAIWGIPV